MSRSTRVVRLLSFLAGSPMHAVKSSTRLRRSLGRCAARLARGLSDFSHCGAHHKLLWDLQHASELRPLTDAVPTERRGLIEHVLGGFETHAMPVLPHLPGQPVHNDLNPHNIVVDPRTHACVAGIIDFGDLTWTARIIASTDALHSAWSGRLPCATRTQSIPPIDSTARRSMASCA